MISNTIKISRSGLKLFLDCPRCFWLDVRHKIKRPPSYPYTLSSAVDFLVKQEFDKYRVKGELPPILKKFFRDDPAESLTADRQQKERAFNGASAKLFRGEQLSEWRNNFKGIRYYDENLNAILYGAVDDILEFSDGSLAVVDYKSSGSKEITIYDDYQKQMDIYSYILEKNGFVMQPEAFFVFFLVLKDGGGFENALPFREELKIIRTNTSWVESAFERAIETARQDTPPVNPNHCDHCHFVQRASEFEPIKDVNI